MKRTWMSLQELSMTMDLANFGSVWYWADAMPRIFLADKTPSTGFACPSPVGNRLNLSTDKVKCCIGAD